MPRTITTAQRAIIAGTSVNHWIQVLFENPDGVMTDISTLVGVDWLESAQWGEDLDTAVSTAKITLRRDTNTTTLAPLFTSTANKNGVGAYAPFIDKGRAVQINCATTAGGVAPVSGDWKPMWYGRVDSVDWTANPIIIECSDLGAWIADAWIRDSIHTYAPEVAPGTGPLLGAVIQSILDGWPIKTAPITLYEPVTAAWQPYGPAPQPAGSIMEAIRNFAQEIGWELRYRFDSSDNFRLTLYEPDRSNNTPDWIIGPTEYTSVTALQTSIQNIRNVISGQYSDGTDFHGEGGTFPALVVTDSSSTAKYGERFMGIKTDIVQDTPTMTNLLNAILSDLSEANTDQTIAMPFFWPVQMGDVIQFAPNTDHYDSAQTLAVVAYQHTFQNGEGITTISTRGQPAGAFQLWLAKGDEDSSTTLTTPEPGSPPTCKITLASEDTEEMVLTLSGTAAPNNDAALSYRTRQTNGSDPMPDWPVTWTTSPALPTNVTITRPSIRAIHFEFQVMQSDTQTSDAVPYDIGPSLDRLDDATSLTVAGAAVVETLDVGDVSSIPSATERLGGDLRSSGVAYFNDMVLGDGTGGIGGGGGGAAVPISDEGTQITASVGSLNFVGAGVTATANGGAVTVTIPGSTAPVTSVFGRTGAVVAATGDYSFAQIGSKPTTLSGYGITDAAPLTGAGTSGTWPISISGLAATATKLATARLINGVSFDGSADITVAAAAGTLTGATLAAGVVASSLTSVGVLTSLAVSGATTFTGQVTVNNSLVVGSNTTQQALVMNGPSGVTRPILFRTGNLNRWAIYANATSESGSNNGSNLAVDAYSDTGTFIDTPILIVRAAGGVMTLVRPITATQPITVGTTTGSQGYMVVNGTIALTATTQYGVFTSPTFNSTATGTIAALYSSVRTAAASYTATSGIGLLIDSPILGSGSAIGTLYGILISPQTAGSANYAIITQGGIHQFGDIVRITGGSVSTGNNLSLWWDATNGGEIQSFSSKPLNLNSIGNAVNVGSGGLVVTGTLYTGSVGSLPAAQLKVGGDIQSSGVAYASDFSLAGAGGGGGGGGGPIIVEWNGGNVTNTLGTLNFTGAGISSVSLAGGVVTVTVASGTTNANALTGTTLASNVVSSSLTTVGTLSFLTIGGSLVVNGVAGGTNAFTGVPSWAIVPAPGSPNIARLQFGTDGSGWQFSISKNTAGTVTDLFSVRDNGSVYMGASATIVIGSASRLTGDSTYTYVRDGNGRNAITIGGSDTATYHDNTIHYFRSIGGAVFGWWNSTGIGSLPGLAMTGTYPLNLTTSPLIGGASAGGGAGRTGYNLAAFAQDTTNVTGAYVIKLPYVTGTNVHMTRVKIAGYLYEGSAAFELTIGFYFYTDGTYHNLGYVSVGQYQWEVRLGVTPDNHACVILEDVGSVHQYPRLAVTEALIGYSTAEDAMFQNWSISLVTSLSGYTGIVPVPNLTTLVTTGSAIVGGLQVNGNITVSADASAKLVMGRFNSSNPNSYFILGSTSNSYVWQSAGATTLASLSSAGVFGTAGAINCPSLTSTGTIAAAAYVITGGGAFSWTGTYTEITDNAGQAYILIGGSGDTGNYYDNDNHYLRNRAHNSTFMQVNASGAHATDFILT